MPTYVIKDTKTKKIKELVMTMSELDDFLKAHPSKHTVIQAPAIVSGVDGLRKIDNGFKDVLKRIKSKHRGSTIDV